MSRAFFELVHDVEVPGMWHLGEITGPGGTVPNLRSGAPCAEPLHIEVTVNGRPVDLTLTAFAIPVASAKVADMLKVEAGADVQLIAGQISGRGEFFVVNCLRIVDCIDENRTAGTRWSPHDAPPGQIGAYREISKLRVDAERIPPEVNVLRPAGWRVVCLVSERIRDWCVANKCKGVHFVRV